MVKIWFWWGNLRERAHFEDRGVKENIIVSWIFRKWAWNGLIWLRIGIGSRLL